MKVRLPQFAIIFLRMSEWLHFVGMRYGGKSLTLFKAPRQSERIITEPVRLGDTTFTARRIR